jgi:hypothetical protein
LLDKAVNDELINFRFATTIAQAIALEMVRAGFVVAGFCRALAVSGSRLDCQ